MIRRPRGLRSRLVLSHLIVALAAVGTVFVAVSLVGPGYFAEAMGHHPGDPEGEAMDAATLAAFQQAVGTALVAALVIALGAAVVVAVALAGRIAGPVTALVGGARRVAAGHYAERVTADGSDEVGELARAFNAMAGSLEATERRRLEVVGDVAHELRTPLTTLDGYLEGLEDGVVAAGPQTWVTLRAETQRLSRIVADLSELWRAETRQLPLSLTTVDAAELAGEVVEAFRPRAEGRSISLAADVPGELAVRADRDRLAQILANYLSNAIRYSPDGAIVTVLGRRDGADAVLTVRDTGPGLDAEQLAHVFDRFYRIDAARARAQGGAGIGLAIVAALAGAMGGRAWVESDGPGRGATFSVALPVP
jgi:signal transduction histidine kinase